MRHDLQNDIGVELALPAQVVTATTVGSIIDRAGNAGCVLAVNIGESDCDAENTITLTVDDGDTATLTDAVQVTAAALAGSIIGTGTDAAALTTVLVGANNDLTFTAVTPGEAGNEITVAYEDTGSDSEALAVTVTGTDIVVSLATDAGDNATADIGAGENGVVTTEVDAAGSAGNDYTIEIEEGAADGVALAATLGAGAILVTLATDDGANATAEIGSGENGVVTATVDAAGSDGNNYTIEVVEGVGINVPLSAVLLAEVITVTLATDGGGALDAAANTATLVAAAVDAIDGVGAAASGTGVTAIAAAEGPTAFTGGGVGFALDAAANTATLVAAKVTLLAGVTATASGTGVTALASAEGPTAFTGGGDNYAITSTAADIIAAIGADEDASALIVAANATGNSGVGVVTAMEEASLSGGADTSAFPVETDGSILIDAAISDETAVGELTYTGTKRYIRLTATVAGTVSGIVAAAAILGLSYGRPT